MNEIGASTDLMGVLDRDAFRYGEELRALAMTKACRHIEFVRVMDVLERRGGSAGGFAGDISAEQAYQSAAPGLRAELERSFLDRAFDVDRELEANPNTRLTFAGFVKLLARDMRWGRHFDRALLDDKRQYDKAVEEVARAMVRRLVVSSALTPRVGRVTNIWHHKADSSAGGPRIRMQPGVRESAAREVRRLRSPVYPPLEERGREDLHPAPAQERRSGHEPLELLCCAHG